MLNEKLLKLEKIQLENLLSELSHELYQYFAVTDEYDSQQELQEDFKEWRRESLNVYRQELDKALEDVLDRLKTDGKIPYDLELNWKDFTTLLYTRWKICSCCNEPFIDYSGNARMQYCYHSVYRKYSMTSKKYFKNAFKTSKCQMERYRINTQKSRRKAS